MRTSVALLVLICTSPLAQRQVFRAGAEYVAVDVVVTDKDDRVVRGLTKDDFTITERGKLQAITDFSFVDLPSARQSLGPGDARRPEPDVATNAPPAPTSRLFALVIDDLHLIESEIVPVQRVLSAFIERLQPDDAVAVVFVGNSKYSQNFTTSRSRILGAVNHLREAFGFGLDAMPIGTNPSTAQRGALNYARSAALVLKNVALAMASSRHARRAVLYVSGGTIIDPNAPIGSTDQQSALALSLDLKDAFETARRADVPIYTIDPRGLVTPETAVRGGIGAVQRAEVREEVTRRVRIQQDYLSTIALNTGGRALINQSDLDKAVGEIVSDNGSFYLLGYRPEPFTADGQFHEISVKVAREGLRVRARSGYTAAAAKATAPDARADLRTAMGSGLATSGLQLQAYIAPVAVGTSGVKTIVTVRVVYPTRGSDAIADTLRLNLLALDSDAKVKASSERAFAFKGTPASATDLAFVIDDAIDLPAQVTTLRLGVGSDALGSVGTTDVPLDLSHVVGSGLRLPSIIIGRAGPPRDNAMHAEAIQGLVPFQPTTGRTFATADTLRVFVPVLWDSSDETAAVTVRILGNSANIEHREVVAGRVGASRGRAGTLDTTQTLTNLATGSYTLEIEARLPNRPPVTRTVPFQIK